MKHTKSRSTSTLIFFAALFMAMLMIGTAYSQEKIWHELSADEQESGSRVTIDSFAALAERLSPTVVHLAVRKKVRIRSPFPDDDLFRWFFQFPRPPQRHMGGLGSGVIINQDGYILTNNHVIEGADEITVKLADEREFRAKLVGADPRTDLALLKIDVPQPLPYAPLGDSDKLRIGEWVIAIGNPFGLDHTVTAGIVSAKGRTEVNPGKRPLYADFIQTDASINPGNSGGPLINLRGEVIGINTAIVAAGQGIGFAIPVNMAKKLLPQLLQGRVERSWLGVYIQKLTPRLAQSLGLSKPVGALVAQVIQGSPADKAGLKPGDVIIEFNDKKVKNHSELAWMASVAGVGKKVKLKVFRNGERLTLYATLARMPHESGESHFQPAQSGGIELEDIGVVIAKVPARLRAELDIPSGTGVVVVKVSRTSIAAAAGLREGDVILQMFYEQITSPKQLKELYDQVPPGKTVSFHIVRRDMHLWLAFTKPGK